MNEVRVLESNFLKILQNMTLIDIYLSVQSTNQFIMQIYFYHFFFTFVSLKSGKYLILKAHPLRVTLILIDVPFITIKKVGECGERIYANARSTCACACAGEIGLNDGYAPSAT